MNECGVKKRHFFEKKVHFFVIFFGGLLFLLYKVEELENITMSSISNLFNKGVN